MGETLKERLDRLSEAASKAHSLSASIRATHEFLDVLSSAYRTGDLIPRDEITPQMAAVEKIERRIAELDNLVATAERRGPSHKGYVRDLTFHHWGGERAGLRAALTAIKESKDD